MAPKSRLAVAVQARVDSTRFPRKVLASLHGRTMFEHVVARAQQIWPEIPVFVLVPHHQAQYFPSGRYTIFEGPVEPLARYAQFAIHHPEIQTIVRVTADCPLLDPGISYLVLQHYYRGRSRGVFTHPDMDGLDTEVVDAAEFVRAYHATIRPYDREHVTPWIRLQPGSVGVNMAPQPLRWSVDYPQDLEWVQQVYDACPSCATGIPHHTNSLSSIGKIGDRLLVVDLHHNPLGDLGECRAADLLKQRMGGTPYVST